MLLSVLVRVGDFLDPCRKNLGACRDSFWSVLLSVSMRIGGSLDACRENFGPCRDLFLSVLLRASMRVGECLGPCRKKSGPVLGFVFVGVGVCLDTCRYVFRLVSLSISMGVDDAV